MNLDCHTGQPLLMNSAHEFSRANKGSPGTVRVRDSLDVTNGFF